MSFAEASTTPLYNSNLLDIFVKFVRKNFPDVDPENLLRLAGIRPYEVADPGHWFTGDQVERFFSHLVEQTGCTDAARQAGKFSASSEALGLLPHYIRGLLDPSNAFALLERAAPTWTRAVNYRTTNLAPNQVLITVTPASGIKEEPFHCECRMGFLETVPRLFNCRLQKIEHLRCIARGDNACHYFISWRRPSDVWRTGRNFSIAAMALLLALNFFTDPHFALYTGLPVAVSFSLLVTMIYEAVYRKELNFNLESFRASADNLLEQIYSNYNNTLMASEIGQAISSQTQTDDILEDVVQILEKRLHYNRGMILLADANRKNLSFRTGFGYSEDQMEWLRKIDFRLDKPESRGIFIIAFRKKKPFLIDNLDQIEEDLSSRSRLLAQKLGVKSFICCPIISEGESVGILAVDNQPSSRPLKQNDLTLLMGIATFIGISLHNADLLDASDRQSRSILRILASSIDARDPLTAGHSEKVTEYALGICEELELPNDFREMIRVASLLHDYGKIGVPDAILKKEGRLNDQEYAIVQTHAEKTREILEQINFKGIFRQVPEVAGAHHEKIDGSGYPRGLKGRDIPLGAKIIAVADYFEAITSERHYRRPMDIDHAFKQMREESGRYFEPRIVEALISFYRRMHALPSSEGGSAEPHQAPQRGKRIPFRTPVTLHVNGLKYQGTSADLSSQGIFVATRDEATQGASVQIAFSLPTESSSRVIAKGRVAWVNSRRERKKPVFPVGMGVEFLDLEKGVAEALQSFIGGGPSSVFVTSGW